MTKKTLITGVLGQTGSYLAELLHNSGYQVHGVARSVPASSASLPGNAQIHAVSLRDFDAVRELIRKVQPDEVYHLAAEHYSSQVKADEQKVIDRGHYLANVEMNTNLLFALLNEAPQARYVFAGSSLMYEGATQSPQTEAMPFAPRSIYGLAKTACAELIRHFREKHGMHASTAVLYNHESPRRAEHFVTSKVVKNMVRIAQGKQESFELGALDTIKDWGFAGDYARGMTLMAQAPHAEDYILATGIPHTIRDLVETTAQIVGISNWEKVVQVRQDLTRQAPPTPLIGNWEKARKQLGWSHSVNFRGLIETMVKSEQEKV